MLRFNEVIEAFPDDAWQNLAAQDALAHVTADAGRSFPCMFAVQAAARDGFRFCFAEDVDGRNIVPGLKSFLRSAHDIGPYAALFYVFPPEEVQALETYRDRFWTALRTLHLADERAWPESVPYNLGDPEWTFCFDGEAVFPLCLTPAHTKKRTRYAANFTISFQPRWTFKHHLPDMEIMKKYSTIIQNKMEVFDETPVSPYLGLYGGGFLDAQKYFLHDDNAPMSFPDKLI